MNAEEDVLSSLLVLVVLNFEFNDGSARNASYYDCISNSTKAAATGGKLGYESAQPFREEHENDPQLALDFVLEHTPDMGAFDLQSRYTSAYVVSTS